MKSMSNYLSCIPYVYKTYYSYLSGIFFCRFERLDGSGGNIQCVRSLSLTSTLSALTVSLSIALCGWSIVSTVVSIVCCICVFMYRFIYCVLQNWTFYLFNNCIISPLLIYFWLILHFRILYFFKTLSVRLKGVPVYDCLLEIYNILLIVRTFTCDVTSFHSNHSGAFLSFPSINIFLCIFFLIVVWM